MWKHWTVIPSPFLHGKLLINVYSSSHFTRCLFFKSVTESVCSPHLPLPPSSTPPPPAKFSKCYHDFQCYSLLQQQFSNEKIWCFERKPWSKVDFLQHNQGYAKASVWFSIFFRKKHSKLFNVAPLDVQ